VTEVGDSAADADLWLRLVETFEDDCRSCGGKGQRRNAQWQEWQRRAGELIAVAQAARRADDLRVSTRGNERGARPNGLAPSGTEGEPAIVAAVERAIDDHMRARPPEPEEEACEACRGTGKELTPVGRRVAEMLVRHGFVRKE
jgi:hypothetical protein